MRSRGLSRAEIERLLPQKEAMCLIDGVTSWDEASILCTADAGRASHPLKGERGVSAVHSVEYGAQAAALHCLLQRRSEPAQSGLLLQIHEARFFVPRLDSLPQPLRVQANCTHSTSEAARYAYQIEAGGVIASTGELTTRLNLLRVSHRADERATDTSVTRAT